MERLFEDKVRNYRLFKLKFYGATNHEGFRARLVEVVRDKKEYSHIFQRDYKYDSMTDQVYDWLRIKGFNVVGLCRMDDDLDYFVIDNYGNDFIRLNDE